jgi:ribosome-binding protein aMBF1 (putative translation factor)
MLAGMNDESPGEQGRVPIMPGFREMALRRMSSERGRLMQELSQRRQQAGLSQTEIAARMGTSQSAVARLETGSADVRASTLERYAAALGAEITWTVLDDTVQPDAKEPPA